MEQLAHMRHLCEDVTTIVGSWLTCEIEKSKEVIEERKKLLAEYMNTLSTNINIFRDEAIVGFLKQDWHSIQISNLANL